MERKGICRNVGACSMANKVQVITDDDAEFICSECNSELEKVVEKAGGDDDEELKKKRRRRLISICAIVIVLLSIIGGIIYALTKPEGPKPGKNTSKVQLTLNHTSKTMKVGESDTLVATVTPEGTQATFVWKASNKSNAVAVADGIVTAKEEGESKVQVQAIVGTDTLSTICAYTVEKAAETRPKPGPQPQPEPRLQPQTKPWTSYATFDGTTMTFTKRHVIPGTDQIANPGDKVTGKWVNGEVNLVRWYHDGTSETLTHK